MPIRLCQKCGLKVLIDESQAGTNPFYCQRCTTAMKGQEGAAAPAAPKPVPAPAAASSRRRSGRPERPRRREGRDRGGCSARTAKRRSTAAFPRSRPAAPAPSARRSSSCSPTATSSRRRGFDLGQWQNEGGGGKAPEPAAASAPEVKETNTRLLVKKYAADAPAGRPAAKSEEPVSAAADTDAADEAGALPGWLDDSAQGGAPVKPVPETDVAIDVVEPPKPEPEPEPLPVRAPEPTPGPLRARSPIVAKQPTISPGRPPTAVITPPESSSPSPEVDLLPEEPAPKPRVLGRVPSGERKSPMAAPVAVAEPGETGGGKVFLALILALLPLAAGGGLLSSRDSLAKNDLVKKVGKRFVEGFAKLDQKLFPPPPPPKPVIEEKKPEPEPPPKEEPPKPDPDQQKKDQVKISHLYTENLMKIRKLKELKKTETADQSAGIKKIEDDINGTENQIKRLRADYQRMYGKDYDPAKD
jgi:hypothetical protein